MRLFALAIRSLLFYWRTTVGVILTVAVGTAVLTGALLVGDSVRYSLRRMVDVRLGRTQLALVPQNRFFRAALADELSQSLGGPVAPVLMLRALVSGGDGARRATDVQVLGVDDRFFTIGNAKPPRWNDGLAVNSPLAARLGVKAGDDIVLRIAKPGIMPRDVPLSPDSDLSVAARRSVSAVLGPDDFGGFNLQANQVAPLNVFVPLSWLQNLTERTGQANMLLAAGDGLTAEQASRAIREHWQPADAALEIHRLETQGVAEIRSGRVFIEQPLADAAPTVAKQAFGVLTYFVNAIRLDDKVTPYSIVSAIQKGATPLVPADMADDEIVINAWLAEDLAAEVGDTVEISYYVIGPMRKLVEESRTFRVRAIVGIEGPAADPTLMPDYPGLADVDNCRDWKPGIPIDLDAIRDKDEKYWDDYRGTPKAFVTLAAGQSLWANRYGNLTMVRCPDGDPNVIAQRLTAGVDPAAVGLFFQGVRQRGLKAGAEGTDFGRLFLGLSMFLILAAIVLVALVFVFGVERRTEQVGMLLAVGLTRRQVRGLLLFEGLLPCIDGVILGTILALLYTRLMILGLSTTWSSAVAGSAIRFHYTAATLITGAVVMYLITAASILLALRKQVSRPARELLAGQLRWQFFVTRFVHPGKAGFIVAILCTVGAIVLPAAMGTGDASGMAGAFFGAGGLLLIAGLGFCQGVLSFIARGRKGAVSSLAGLAVRNTTRRTGRSLAVVVLLAVGVFLVVAVGANRQDPMAGAGRRDSGTGGFEFYAESTVPLLHDLNTADGLKAVGLDPKLAQTAEFIQMRIHEGDDASCFNLNRAQRPRLLGVSSLRLADLNAFSFAATFDEKPDSSPWRLLVEPLGDDIVPAIADAATVTWALGKKIGDEVDYLDERGRPFRARIVATLRNSVLQGPLLIHEAHLAARFPSEDGYRAFLIDAGPDAAKSVESQLSDRLADYGLNLTPTVQRLAAFNSVQNTYLTIFQMLGGLGLVVGSIGLALVVLRNVLDRRGELAMLRAVGFRKNTLSRMLLYEHWALLAAALMIGVLAALVAVMPALRAPGADVPGLSLGLTVAAIAVSGMIWVALATRIALGGEMLDALRNE